ncbi:MAG: hypothetical protein Q9182_003996 [Xanthomendoza sp. 2 TL-2023]
MGLLELPNEVILLILGNLSKARLKRTRLVCAKLAQLGARTLMDVVYISPRSKDMEVFDAITQNPAFSSAIKHIVYDCAQWVDYSIGDYFDALENQFRDREYHHLRSSNNAVGELMDLIHPHQKGYMSRIQGLKNCKEHAGFMEGFRQYSLLATGQDDRPVVDSPWFTHVCEGLRKLGSIHSVVIRNTWDMIYDDDIGWDSRDDRSDTSAGDTNEEVYDGHQSDSSDLEKDDDDWSDCSSSYAFTMERPIAGAPGLRNDGTRSVGSPLARTWPPERLQPPFTRNHLSDREMVCSRIWDDWYSVYDEIILVIQMLKSANKQPLSLRVPGNKDQSESLSPGALSMEEPPKNPFIHLASHLKKLELSIASLEYGTTVRLVPNLGLLIDFLKRAKSLTWLNLRLPVENPDSDSDSGSDHEEESENEGYSLYKFANVFPPLSQLQLNNLTDLILYGLEITYRDLAGLLFLKLPKLKTLAISYIQLVKGGHWEDIVEGLRRISDLKECILGSPLLYSNFQTYPSRLHPLDDEFLLLNSTYIMSGVPACHPALKRHERESASGKYLERLNETLDEVRKSIGT